MADVNNENKDVSSLQTSTQEPELDQKTINLINSAISTHLKRHLAKLPDMIKEALPQSSSQDNTSSAKPSDKETPDAMSEVQKLRAELDAERKRNRDEKTFGTIRNYLTGKVRPEALETAVKVLKADGKVNHRRDGTPIVKFSDTEEYDLEEGLHQWLNSKDAEIFRPAPSNKQSGLKDQKPAYRSPSKVSNSGNDEGKNLSPSEKTLLQLQKMGLSL
jgi:hypothetical protein